jgi:hypothetical protein
MRVGKAALCLVLGNALILGRAPALEAGGVPDLVDLKKVNLAVVEAYFVTKLHGGVTRFEETKPDKYRGLVLTLKITKPAGEPLSLREADLVLHYRRGSSSDVARCFGLSGFSTSRDVDRPMSLHQNGTGMSETGPATTKAETIYVDVFFQYMESDTSELHLLVAQPVGASFTTKGWK